MSLNASRSASLALRILTFRASGDDLLSLNKQDLLFGLLCCWVVGIGRWWDDPGASLFLHLGLVSLVYPFLLGALLWLFILPLRPQQWSYIRLVTFISLTAPPAILYAIPVERLATMDVARSFNAWFLAIVALWRLALLLMFVLKTTKLGVISALIGSYAPILGVVSVLSVLNLQRVVLNFMGGFQGQEGPHDAAFGVLVSLTFFMVAVAPAAVLIFLVMVIIAWVRWYRAKKRDGAGTS